MDAKITYTKPRSLDDNLYLFRNGFAGIGSIINTTPNTNVEIMRARVINMYTKSILFFRLQVG